MTKKELKAELEKLRTEIRFVNATAECAHDRISSLGNQLARVSA